MKNHVYHLSLRSPFTTFAEHTKPGIDNGKGQNSIRMHKLRTGVT